MADYTHYDGGRSEEAVVSAINHLLTDDEADTVNQIKNVYWRIGEIIEIAIAEGYTKALGLKGWFFLRFGKSETHARDCLNAWGCRRDFDRAYQWYKQGNTGFVPKKLSGPRFCIEVVTAWRNRLNPDKPTRRRGATAKQLRAVIAAYRSGFGRLKTEHVRWAEEDQRDSRVLTVIEQEIEEAEAEIATGTDGTGQWPLKRHAMRTSRTKLTTSTRRTTGERSPITLMPFGCRNTPQVRT